MNEIFVSLRGSDVSGNGTWDNPLASFEKARDIARNNIGKTTIYIREGKYFFEKPLELNEWDSETVFMAYPGEKVVLTGARSFSNLVWDKDFYDPGIRNAFIGKNLKADQLFIDKVPYIMARYPNYKEGIVPLGGVTTEEELKERSRKWSRPETGYIRALHEAGWGGNDYYILGRNEESALGLDIEWIGDNNRGHLYKKDALMVENIREELDSEGEWFYDAQTGVLSVIPYADANKPEESEIELAVNTEIFHLAGTNMEHVIKNITISGFVIENTGRTMFRTKEKDKQYFPLMRGDWAVVRSGSIYVENAENVTIEDCEFSNIGGNAVFCWGYNNGHVIRNNEMLHIGSSAVQLVGSPCAVSEPSFWEHKWYPQHQVHADSVARPDVIGPVSEEYPRDIEISNNHIFDVGIFEKQSSGINLSVTSRIKILYNTIHRSARSNINVNDGSFGGHEIAYNDIFDSQIETTDHGPFNSWGRDRFWSVPFYNAGGLNGGTIRHYIKDGKEYDLALLDAYQKTTIHHNRFHHANEETHSWGIDMDDGSSNYEIYENLCLGIGIKLREGFERNVHHNVIVDGQMQVHCAYKEARDKIYGNLFVHERPWGLGGLGENEEQRLKEADLFVDNNGYYCMGKDIVLPEYWKCLEYDKHSVFDEAPDFANPAENDYTITNKVLLKKLGISTQKTERYGKKNCSYHPPVYNIKQRQMNSDLCETQWMGAVISNIDEVIMSSTATAGTNGVYFKKVSRNSIAYEIGYRTHQVVKSVNGIEINNVSDFLKYIGM